MFGAGRSAGYQTQKSLRLRSSVSAYAGYTPAVAGNTSTWAISGFFRVCKQGVAQELFGAGDDPGGTLFYIAADGTLRLSLYLTAAETLVTSAKFRDLNAPYHVYLAVDTTQATASERVRLYVNNKRITAFTSTNYPALNALTHVNSTRLHTIGRRASASPNYLDGYLSEFYLVDGKAPSPTVFGEYDYRVSTFWRPKNPERVRAAIAALGGTRGGFGTNGAFLPFNDPTSLTTLGYDRSQSPTSTSGNNWTLTNVSLVPGIAYDSSNDVPLGSGNGRGSFATLNPLNRSGSTYAISDGNLKWSGSGGVQDRVFGSFGLTSGKWCWEVTVNNLSTVGGLGGYSIIGVSRNLLASTSTYDNTALSYIGDYGNIGGIGGYKGNRNAGVNVPYGTNYGTTAVVTVELDLDNGTLGFRLNGIHQGLAFTNINATYPGTYFPVAFTDGGNTNLSLSFNFGQTPLLNPVSPGFKTVHTGNFQEPTGAALEPWKHFDAKTHIGNGTTQVISGTYFQPALVWIKARSAAIAHGLFDGVRGPRYGLFSNTTSAEFDYGTGSTSEVSSLNSDGFSLGSFGNFNQNTTTYVDWLWKAGGAAVTNTAGSITSQVSANVAAGFSIVTYTGTGVNVTVGHGLGVAPKMVIVKDRSQGVQNWAVWHTTFASSEVIDLNSTAAKRTSATVWNSNLPTSAVISIGNQSQVNIGSNNYVAYCFAEVPGYSKIGSYIGNGSALGTPVDCGFKPRWLLVKRVDSAGGWHIHDSERNQFNPLGFDLQPQLSNAESTVETFDFTTAGFVNRRAGADQNASGGVYMYIAIAETPTKYTNAV